MRLKKGMKAPPFIADAFGDKKITLGDYSGQTVLLKFHRFASCPACRLHHSFWLDGYDKIEETGLPVLAFFHSPMNKISEEVGSAPFELIADPEKKIFKSYGIESSANGFLKIGTWKTMAKSISRGFYPRPHRIDIGVTSFPADFFIDGNGTVAYARYGTHLGDSMSVEDVLEVHNSIKANRSL